MNQLVVQMPWAWLQWTVGVHEDIPNYTDSSLRRDTISKGLHTNGEFWNFFNQFLLCLVTAPDRTAWNGLKNDLLVVLSQEGSDGIPEFCSTICVTRLNILRERLLRVLRHLTWAIKRLTLRDIIACVTLMPCLHASAYLHIGITLQRRWKLTLQEDDLHTAYIFTQRFLQMLVH